MSRPPRRARRRCSVALSRIRADRKRPIRTGRCASSCRSPPAAAPTSSRVCCKRICSSAGPAVVVENRAGAAGRIGTALVAKSDADGHTLLVSTESSLVIAPHIGQSIGYDPLKDFAPVSLLTRNTVMLVVHPSVPANTLQEFMALARAQPGQLFYASSGVGGPNHLAGEIFNRTTGLKSRMCRSTAPALACRR